MSIQERDEADKLKKLAEFRTRLEKKIETLSRELEDSLILLEFVDAALLEKGFKKAEVRLPVSKTLPPQPVLAPSQSVASAVPPVLEYESSVPLKTMNGELLANLYIDKNSLRAVLAEDKSFNINTPPFLQFLVERVFVKMQDKDRQASASGELEPDKIFSFKIVQDGDILKEILVENVSEDRLRELKTALRWTLEKMYEKAKPPDI